MKLNYLLMFSVIFFSSLTFGESKELPAPPEENSPAEVLLCEKYNICPDSDPGCVDEDNEPVSSEDSDEALNQ